MSNFTITAEALLRAMTIIDKSQGKNCDCWLSYNGAGCVRVANDGPAVIVRHGIIICVDIPVQGEGTEFACRVKHATMTKLVTLCRGMTIHVSYDKDRPKDEQVTIEFGDSGEFKLPLPETDNSRYDSDYTATVLASYDVATIDLATAVARVAPFCATKNKQTGIYAKAFGGVWLQADEISGLNVLATDGNIFAYENINARTVKQPETKGEETPILTGRYEMARFCAPFVAAGCERMTITFPTVTTPFGAFSKSDEFVIRVLNYGRSGDKFPKWKGLIPATLPLWFRLKKDEAEAVRDFAQTLENANMRINFAQDVEGAMPGTLPGKGQIKFRAIASSRDVASQYNAGYIAKALKFFDGDDVYAYTVANDKPIMLKGYHRPGLVIVTPISLDRAPKPETEPAATAEAV